MIITQLTTRCLMILKYLINMRTIYLIQVGLEVCYDCKITRIRDDSELF